VDNQLFIQNRKDLYAILENNSIVILFSGKPPHKSNDAYYKFEVNRNFYYLTGIQRENIIFMALKHQDKVEEYLFIEKNDPILEKWVGAKISVEETTAISGIKTILYQEDFKLKLVRLLSTASNSIENVCFDLSRYAWCDVDNIPSTFSKELLSKYPYLHVSDVSRLLIQLRSIKKPLEIDQIKKAIDITNEGIKHMMINAKPGMKECEFEAYFDFILKSKGAEHAFDTIAASGINGTILHYVKNNRVVQDNDLILFDLGANINNYCADISRTFPVNGVFTERQKAIYNVVLSSMKEVINHMKPGVSMGELNIVAKKYLAQGSMEIGLINALDEIDQYYYHSIGHPLGLDTHDVGDRDIILQPGMVYTCEPGLYIDKEGIGIRIEDDILITEDGNINLSEHIIKEVDEIEEFLGSCMKCRDQ